MNGIILVLTLTIAVLAGQCEEPLHTGTTLPIEFSANGQPFTPSDPVSFVATVDANDQRAMQFRMSPADAKSFGAFTAQHIGKAIDVRVCGEIVVSPVLQTEIYAGQGIFAGSDTWQRLSGYLETGCP